MEIGLDFLSDSPVNVGQLVLERHRDVDASQPRGIGQMPQPAAQRQRPMLLAGRGGVGAACNVGLEFIHGVAPVDAACRLPRSTRARRIDVKL